MPVDTEYFLLGGERGKDALIIIIIIQDNERGGFTD